MKTEAKTDLIQLVDRTYREFERDFTPENFPSVFDWIRQFNRQISTNKTGVFGKAAHPAAHPLLLSPHPIFQTPVRAKPKIMLVGNNNSWFDRSCPTQAEKNLSQLVSSAPKVNSYMDHSSDFALDMKKIFGPDKDGFEGLGKLEYLSACVGINRQWIQIGSNDKPYGLDRGMQAAARKHSLSLGQSFTEYCEIRTRALIDAIQPEILVMLGGPAQDLYKSHAAPNGCQVVHSDSPSNRRGGPKNVAAAIRPFL